MTWLLASLEAAVVGVAEQQKLETPRHHWKKVKVAEDLYRGGHLPFDVSDLLDLLNDSRKEAIYEGEEPDLGDHSLQNIASATETIVEIVEETE